MRKGLENPNSIQAVREAKMEIASELGIMEIAGTDTPENVNRISEVNKRLVLKARTHLIGFK